MSKRKTSKGLQRKKKIMDATDESSEGLQEQRAQDERKETGLLQSRGKAIQATMGPPTKAREKKRMRRASVDQEKGRDAPTPRHNSESVSDCEDLEAVAETALTKMYRQAEGRKLMSLTEINAEDSASPSERPNRGRSPSPISWQGSQRSESPSPTAVKIQAMKAQRRLRLEVAEAALEGERVHKAALVLEAERAARLKIHVETSKPAEQVYAYWGSMGVTAWLRRSLLGR
ncbi:hypothetical protein C8R43DRAFT_948469 [Mycena crocata]|nr:hypothetical protein C8R43DRAFT_948469 [Mycena crocata]